MNAARRHPWGWRFWLVSLAALLAMAGTAALGFWQLDRAAQKRLWQAAIDARASEPVLSGAALATVGEGEDPGAPQLLHRRVQLRGRWLVRDTVFLDNRQMHGRPGFFVVTPLRLDAPGSPVVLVQRGWAPRDFQQRARLPEVPTPTGEVSLEGRIAGPPSRLYDFAPAGAGEGSSRIRQNLDVAAFAAETGLPLPALTVVQTSAAADGLARDWPSVDRGVDKHYGYAFQWFGLCGLVAFLYVWFQILQRVRRSRR